MGTVSVVENPSPTAVFIDHFIDCIDSLPDDIQRNVSQLRELDLLYRTKLNQISGLLDSYNSTDDQTIKQRYSTKIQRCLVKSQEYGDEKLQLISQIVEMADNRNLQILKDAENMDAPIRRAASPLITKIDHPRKYKAQGLKSAVRACEACAIRPRVYIFLCNYKTVNFEDHRGMEKHTQNKRPRRQKTTNERFIDIQERLIKPEKAPKIEKAPKVEKTTKSEKKTKAAEKTEPMEVAPVVTNATVETTTHKKTSETTKKEKEVTTTKKKTTKQKDTKKKNGAVKKKKKKEVADIPIDPDEPTYCSCNQVSFGEMIGCDNEECPIEWFHFSCVNLTTKPKGKWYCPQCTIERREKSKK